MNAKKENWSDAEGEANARIIAAAPELLAALKALAEYVRDEYESEVNEETLGPLFRAACSAIDTAEGRDD